MRRIVAAVVVALAIAASVGAQDRASVFTVTVASAEVYKGPSNVTPVIGHVARGAVLPVLRHLGSWVKVPWHGGEDGFGYVHVTMGRVAPGTPGPVPASPAGAAPRSAAAPSPVSSPQRTPVTSGVAARRPPVVAAPASHLVGVGGVFASMRSVGATGRVWRADRFGLQAAFAREAMTSGTVPGRLTTMQFEPGVLYALADLVSDYVWVRPYVGTSLSVRQETLRDSWSGADASSTGLGVRAFGGAEFTFASVPRFGVSVDLGYRRVPAPFSGFDAAPVSAAIAGHWYVK